LSDRIKRGLAGAGYSYVVQALDFSGEAAVEGVEILPDLD
jgi:hypothetical protein